MKNKRNSERDDYRLLKNKLLIRIFGMLFFAFAFLAAFYSLFLKGHIADTFVGFLDNFVYHDYDRAYNVYSIYIRDYMSLFFVVLSLLLFAIILRFYLNEFSKYFKEINRSIDALIEENSGDIVLPSELTAIEKKINHIKHTLEQRKLAAELSEQRKNDLVVYLAHDLKTPLTSVIGYLTLLRDENKISEELREKYLSISLEKAEHLEDLINEFFEITRFNLSNITLEYSRVNLTRMLEQLTYEFKPMLLEKNLKCELEIAPDTMIKCDVNKMQRVFDNLMRNAVNYSFDDSTIHIAVKQNGENLCIQFTNCGNTIPKEKLVRIFEQFYRLDVARSSRSGGAGLGLAVAKEIVELHNGTITAKVKMSKSNLQSLFRSCRKIVRNSAGKHRKLLWGNEKKARLLLVHLQYQKQACFFSLSGRKNDVNSYPTNQETPSLLIYLHPDFTDSISRHLCSAFCRDRYIQQGIIAFH